MSFFAKTKLMPGWLAVVPQANGIQAVHAQRMVASRPSIESATFFPVESGAEASALEKFSKEMHADRFQCTTLLGAGDYQLLSVDAPNVPAEELKTAIRWRLKDMLDFHVDDATVDVLAIPPDKNAPSRNSVMYAVAARNQTVQQRQSLFEQGQIPLSVIDIPELAQRNLSALAEPDGRGLAMLSFGPEGGLFTVTFAQELYLSRRIDISESQLQQADEAQMATLLDRITLELQRSLDHFDRQFHFITVSKLLIAPLGNDDHGLKDYLASNLYLPVESFALESVLDLARVPELLQPDAQQRFLLTIGAALRHEEKVL